MNNYDGHSPRNIRQAHDAAISVGGNIAELDMPFTIRRVFGDNDILNEFEIRIPASKRSKREYLAVLSAADVRWMLNYDLPEDESGDIR